MKNKTIYLLCGLPGSGKSTWAKARKTWRDAYVSRDEVRFAIVKENEQYFSKEEEVFNTFIDKIIKKMKTHSTIYIDATHLSEKARNRVLDRLPLSNVDIIPVNFYISLDTCCYRNDLRSGRAHVPTSAICKMNFIPARFNEKHYYTKLINIYEDGEEMVVSPKR